MSEDLCSAYPLCDHDSCVDIGFNREIDQLRAALAEAQAEIERLKKPWKSIEDAPRDGARILTYSPKAANYEKAEIRINRWHNECWWNCNNTYWAPTHYAPIPAPPSDMVIPISEQGGEK